jgi:hypothetical protein
MSYTMARQKVKENYRLKVYETKACNEVKEY